MLKRSPQLSPLFDVYWRFAAARQELYFARLEGKPQPWTDDPILAEHRFTNAYRAADRVSQFLIREVIYDPRFQSPDDLVYRLLLFKFFNRISTWHCLEQAVGPLRWDDFHAHRFDAVLSSELAKGTSVYSAAYMIPPVSLDTSGVKHRGHLRLLEHMMDDGVVAKIQQTQSLQELFRLLRSYPSLGDFLAFQLTIDIAYSPLVDHTEAEFVVAGPGARDGLSKVFVDAKDHAPTDLIQFMVDRQEEEFDRLGIRFRDLFGRRLQPIDCQNLFCEISKYSRVSHPELAGVAGRTRIKQRYKKDLQPFPAPWFPPKWGLNDRLPAPADGLPSTFKTSE